MEKDVGVGSIIGETLNLLGQNMRAVLLFVVVISVVSIAGLAMGLVDANDSIASLGYDFRVTTDEGLLAALYQLAAAAVTIVAAYFLLAEMLKGRGRLGSAEPRIWAYIGMSILALLGYVIGFLLLVVPGVILMVRWAASSGFLIGAREDVVGSLSASWDATRGHSWAIFFAGVVLFIGLVIVAGVIGGITAVTGVDLLVASISAVLESFANALFLAFGIGVYLLVHNDSTQTAEVFS